MIAQQLKARQDAAQEKSEMLLKVWSGVLGSTWEPPTKNTESEPAFKIKKMFTDKRETDRETEKQRETSM